VRLRGNRVVIETRMIEFGLTKNQSLGYFALGIVA
jgi:hypothetical protein